jgi:chorismate mutase/prephenate dehydrogenase
MAADDDLEALRRAIDEADDALLEAAARRQRLSAQIRALKSERALPAFDRDRERAVMARAAARAGALGLDPETARALLSALLRAPERAHSPLSPSPGRLLLVGGEGQMGRLLARQLRARGHEVDVLEPGDPRDVAAVVAGADVTMLCVPMAAAAAVAAAVAPHVRPDALLCDINSLKAEICAVMARGCRGEVLGMHPLFGPSVASLWRQKLALCAVRVGPRAAWLTAELAQLGLELIHTTPDAHDRAMALVQALTHLHTLALGDALRRLGASPSLDDPLASPAWRLALCVLGRLLGQDPDLYAGIALENPYAADAARALALASGALAQIAADADQGAFRDLFVASADHLRALNPAAAQTSDALLALVSQEP